MISLITCVHNGQQYIKKYFDSIKNQNFSDFEIIIINDCSTDNTQSLLNEYCLKFNNLRVINNEKNSGPGACRNIGVVEAKGEYVCFADIDDQMLPNYLTILNSLTVDNIDLGVAQIYRVFNGKHNVIVKRFNYVQDTAEMHKEFIASSPWLLTKIMIAPYAKIIKKNFLTENNIKFSSGKYHEDLYFTISLLLCNPIISISNERIYNYNVHQNSVMTGKNIEKLNDIYYVFEELLQFSKETNTYEEYYEEIVYLAYYHIAIGAMYRLFVARPLMLFSNRKTAIDWLSKNGLKCKSNKYINNMSKSTRLYLRVFFGVK